MLGAADIDMVPSLNHGIGKTDIVSKYHLHVPQLMPARNCKELVVYRCIDVLILCCMTAKEVFIG